VECTIKGAKGDTDIYSKNRVHHQENRNQIKAKNAKRSSKGRKRLPRTLWRPKTGMVKHTTGALSTKCGHFTRQVNANWKVLRKKTTTTKKKKKKINYN